MANTFTVRTADMTRYIESKFLQDANGNFIKSPNAAQKDWNLFDTDGNFIGTNTNGYLIVPANLDIKTAIDFGRSLAALGVSVRAAMIDAFQPGGWLDIQTNYNGMTGDNVPAYRAAASYLLGIVGAEAKYTLDQVKFGGGAVNLIQYMRGNVKDVSGEYNNSVDNIHSMTDGYNAQLAHIFSPSTTPLSSIFTSSSIVDANGGLAVDATFTGTGGSPIVIRYTVDPTGNNVNMSLGDPAHGVSTYQMIGGLLTNSSQTDSLGYVLTTAYNYVDGQKSSQQTSAVDNSGALKAQQDVFTNGTTGIKYLDPQNTHSYNKLEVTKAADGKVTTAQITLDPNVLAAGMSIGQIFGSALGAALGGNSLVGNLAGGAIGGLIGQKFIQVLATAMTADLSTVSLNDVFLSPGVSVANAGIGAVSSFLTAELGHALHINGFDGQLFNTAVSGFTTSLLIQVTDKMARGSLDFAGAIAAMDWTQALSGAIDAAQINLGNLLGGYLGHELVPAQTREGAVGGQLLGAVGSAIGISIVLANALGTVLNFIVPGLGSLIGTIVGTLIGGAFGSHPHPAAVDLIDQAGYFYDYSHSQLSASDGGDYRIPDQMKDPTLAIINAYLNAVKGAALDHSKQAIIGYTTAPDFRYLSGTPGHPERTFTGARGRETGRLGIFHKRTILRAQTAIPRLASRCWRMTANAAGRIEVSA